MQAKVLCLIACLAIAGTSFGQTPEKATNQGKPVGDWVKGLKDKSPEVREAAATALGAVGAAEHKRAVKGLVERLKDSNQHVRHAAIEALGYIGPAAKAAVPDLNEVVNKEKGDLRNTAREALKKIQQK